VTCTDRDQGLVTPIFRTWSERFMWGYIYELEHFVECIRTGRQPRAGGQDGRYGREPAQDDAHAVHELAPGQLPDLERPHQLHCIHSVHGCALSSLVTPGATVAVGPPPWDGSWDGPNVAAQRGRLPTASVAGCSQGRSEGCGAATEGCGAGGVKREAAG